MDASFTVTALDPATETVVKVEIQADTAEEAEQMARARGLAGATARPTESDREDAQQADAA